MQKVKTINFIYNVQIGGFLLALFIECALFFYQCDICCIGLIDCVTQRHCFRDWWIWDKTKHEFITPSAYITAQKTPTFDRLHWIFLCRSEPGECGAENMVICPQFKCITKPCFVYARWILHWALKPTIILCSPGWVIHLGLLSCLLNKKPGAPRQPPTLRAPQGLSQS